MSDDLTKRISKSIFDTDLIATRIMLGIAEGLWAIMLWWPGDTFGRPTYAHMARVMSEDGWGLVFALSAATQLHIVFSGQFHRSYARLFAGWNAVLWSYVVGSMLLSVYPPPAAIAGEIALTISAIWIWVKPAILFHFYRQAYVESRKAEL